MSVQWGCCGPGSQVGKLRQGRVTWQSTPWGGGRSLGESPRSQTGDQAAAAAREKAANPRSCSGLVSPRKARAGCQAAPGQRMPSVFLASVSPGAISGGRDPGLLHRRFMGPNTCFQWLQSHQNNAGGFGGFPTPAQKTTGQFVLY